jgi:hypothetical protein
MFEAATIFIGQVLIVMSRSDQFGASFRLEKGVTKTSPQKDLELTTYVPEAGIVSIRERIATGPGFRRPVSGRQRPYR